MITGAHSIIYTSNAEADRAFFRDILRFDCIDTGGGWLIFGLPPSEVAFHPANVGGKHEFYLLCENIDEFVASMEKSGVPCSSIHEEEWGRLVKITLPGGSDLGVYQPLHGRCTTE